MMPRQQIKVKEFSGLQEFSDMNGTPQSDDFEVSISKKRGVFVITKK